MGRTGKKKIFKSAGGFTLIELAIVLMLFGILVSVGLLGFSRISQTFKITETQEKMDVAFNALSSYVQRYKRLPCPADPNGNGVEHMAGRCFDNASADALYSAVQGVLPWRTLGIPESVVRDGWGRYFTYKPAPELTIDYLSLEMQNNDVGFDSLDIHDACRSLMWFSGRGNNDDPTYIDRQKALFCCSTPPRQNYLALYQSGSTLPSGWRGQSVINTGEISAVAAQGLTAGSQIPGNLPVQSTNAWADSVDENGVLLAINDSDGNPVAIGGDFDIPDHGPGVANGSPDAPMERAMGQAVTLISHGGNGLLSFLRGQNNGVRLQGTLSAAGISGGGDISPDERLNVWPPQVVAGSAYHPKVSAAGAFDPFGLRSGASDDRTAYLRTDQIFSRIGSASCMPPPTIAPPDTTCLLEAIDPVEVLKNPQKAKDMFANNSGLSRSLQPQFVHKKSDSGYKDSLGFYEIGEDGELQNIKMLSLDYTTVAPESTQSPDPVDLDGTVQGIGAFIIPNGYRVNNAYAGIDMTNLQFIYDYGKPGERPARIDDPGPLTLVSVPTGTVIKSTVKAGGVVGTETYHAVSSLNKDNLNHNVTESIDDGTYGRQAHIGFEDLHDVTCYYTKSGLCVPNPPAPDHQAYDEYGGKLTCIGDCDANDVIFRFSLDVSGCN